jgi:hypothetical protein
LGDAGGDVRILRLNVAQSDCYFALRYQTTLDNLTFRFCDGGCSLSGCGWALAHSFYSSLGVSHSVEVFLRVDNFDVGVYPGCDGRLGDFGKTFIRTGSPNSDVSVRLKWRDRDNGQTGYTWHSISKSQSKVSGQQLWSYGADDEIFTSESHTAGRTLRICLNSGNDVLQAGKQYGISPTAHNVELIEVRVGSLVDFESTQDRYGIVDLWAYTDVHATVKYHWGWVAPGPIVEWLNN